VKRDRILSALKEGKYYAELWWQTRTETWNGNYFDAMKQIDAAIVERANSSTHTTMKAVTPDGAEVSNNPYQHGSTHATAVAYTSCEQCVKAAAWEEGRTSARRHVQDAVDTVADAERELSEVKARCLAAEARVEVERKIREGSVGAYVTLATAARQLVAALPKCTQVSAGVSCSRPATRTQNGGILCDKHRRSDMRGDCAYAAPLRALAALLPGEQNV
jgi:hypothetical protein